MTTTDVAVLIIAIVYVLVGLCLLPVFAAYYARRRGHARVLDGDVQDGAFYAVVWPGILIFALGALIVDMVIKPLADRILQR